MAYPRRPHRNNRNQAIQRARRMRGQARAKAQAQTKTLLDDWDDEGLLIDEPAENSFDYSPALFQRFPHLAENIPWVSLRGAMQPSIPRRLQKTQHLFGENYAFMKEESLDFFLMPEHEARKLEFILGQDEFMNAKKWISVDDSRAEHALSIAKAAQVLAKDADVVVRRSKLDSASLQRIMAIENLGATLRLRDSERGFNWTLAWLRFWGKLFGARVVPESGACGRGAIGYVSAMMDLDDAVGEGHLPIPDYIYVPLRSGVILAGLELGKRILGWDKTQIVGVASLHVQKEKLAEDLAQWSNEAWEILKPWMPYDPIKSPLTPKDFHLDFSTHPERKLSLPMHSWMMRFIEIDRSELEFEGAGRALWAMSHAIERHSYTGKTFLLWNTTCPFRMGDLGDFSGYASIPKKLKRWAREEQAQGRLTDIGAV